MNTQEIIESACKKLISLQNDNGSWSVIESDVNVPPFFNHEIVRTSEALRALIITKNSNYSNSISKGLTFSLNTNLEESDNINFYASKLKILKFIDSNYSKKIQENYINIILSKQNENGYWDLFPNTYNLLNYSIVESLYDYDDKKIKDALLKLKYWVLNNKAKDNLGWGYDQNSNESQNSYTANIILSILKTNSQINIEELKEAYDFLKNNQNSDGGFSSSTTTISDQSTVYSTSLSLMCMLFFENDLNSEHILNAVNFLIDSKLDDGGWGLLKTDNQIQLYSTYYAIYTLELYQYLKTNYSAERYNFITKDINFNRFLFVEFEKEINQKFKLNFLKSNNKVLGQTHDSSQRRKEILNIISDHGFLDQSQIIDYLKEIETYSNLKKKYHSTLIKNDLEYLKSIGLLMEYNTKYCLIINY